MVNKDQLAKYIKPLFTLLLLPLFIGIIPAIISYTVEDARLQKPRIVYVKADSIDSFIEYENVHVKMRNNEIVKIVMRIVS